MNVSLEQMQQAVEKWQSNMSDLSEEIQYKLAHDSNCGSHEIIRIFNTIRSLERRVLQGDSGPVSQKLYICLEGFPSSLETSYYGYLSEYRVPTETEILSGRQVGHTKGGSVIIPFDTGDNDQDYKFMWFAQSNTEPIKNWWEDLTNTLNQSSIGGGDNLFGSHVAVGHLNVYVTNWATIYHKTEAIQGIRMSIK